MAVYTEYSTVGFCLLKLISKWIGVTLRMLNIYALLTTLNLYNTSLCSLCVNDALETH